MVSILYKILQNTYMLPDKPVKAPDDSNKFTPLLLPQDSVASFPIRDSRNKKLDITELFTHFTASIIKEDVTFIR